ncbi:hypothetical protein R3P38DRAFT_2801526 [Favolaschia claudopus]|uniref:Uncharacterized protein n=1 Tax=Favolaschia claudopus TaxID=2862362 RepID=A0AAV9ZWR2_9AGAR
MFLPASIALLSFLSLSSFTISAPLTTRKQPFNPLFCTGTGRDRVCRPLNQNGKECTNTPGITSLVLSKDADCFAFPQPNCDFNVHQAVKNFFSDTQEDLGGEGIQSVQCSQDIGTVNGFTAGSEQDIAQQKVDVLKGIEIPMD